MNRKPQLILLLSLAVFASCDPKKSEPVFNDVDLPIVKIDPLWTSAIAKDRPVLGKSGTILQFPFGPANPATSKIRLAKVLTNGKLRRTYQYNSADHLVERMTYYTDGQSIFEKTTYKYSQSGLSEIIRELNKEAVYLIPGYPNTNDLRPGDNYSFIPTIDSLAWIKQVYKSVNAAPVVDEVHFGFSPAGALIWQERVDKRGRVKSYTLYQRNELGNITLSKSNYHDRDLIPSEQYFTYDNHPNPYRTTGDFQTNDFFDFDASNTNNVLTQGDADNPEWRYEYQYRSDGYPSSVKGYRSGELALTVEYIYNR